MRRATIRTTHDNPEHVAQAIRPDNTDEMQTEATGDTVTTRIERETTAGLQATVDDYVVNLAVAMEVSTDDRRTGEPSNQELTNE